MTMPRTLPEQFTDLVNRISELERRGRNSKRTGRIAEVGEGDKAGFYRVRLSGVDGKPFMTGWSRPRTLGAGGVKIDVILSMNEQVDVSSENGDMTDAVIDLSTYSEENARANSDVPFHIKIGETTIAVGGDGMTFTAASGHLA